MESQISSLFSSILTTIKDYEDRTNKQIAKHDTIIQEKDQKIQVLNGRYGIYLKCGKTNVSLAKDTDLEKFTIDEAVVLLEEKLKDKNGLITRQKKISNKKTTCLMHTKNTGRMFTILKKKIKLAGFKVLLRNLSI